MTSEQLLILLMLALVPLVNVAVRMLKKPVESKTPPAKQAEVSKLSPRVRRPPSVVAPRQPHEGPVAARNTASVDWRASGGTSVQCAVAFSHDDPPSLPHPGATRRCRLDPTRQGWYRQRRPL